MLLIKNIKIITYRKNGGIDLQELLPLGRPAEGGKTKTCFRRKGDIYAPWLIHSRTMCLSKIFWRCSVNFEFLT